MNSCNITIVQSNEHTETLPHETEPRITTNLSVPKSMWKAVKDIASDRVSSAQSIWIEAMAEYLKRHGVKTKADAA